MFRRQAATAARSGGQPFSVGLSLLCACPFRSTRHGKVLEIASRAAASTASICEFRGSLPPRPGASKASNHRSLRGSLSQLLSRCSALVHVEADHTASFEELFRGPLPRKQASVSFEKACRKDQMFRRQAAEVVVSRRPFLITLALLWTCPFRIKPHGKFRRTASRTAALKTSGEERRREKNEA